MLFSPGPTIAQHTDDVLGDLLGDDEAEIVRVERDQVRRCTPARAGPRVRVSTRSITSASAGRAK